MTNTLTGIKYKIYEKSIDKAKNFYDLDKAYVCRGLGYKSNFDYYTNESWHRGINKIKIPSLFIVTEDDPVVGPQDLYKEKLKKNPNIFFLQLKMGGHLGLYEGLTPKRWY